ncbi:MULTISPECIES: cytochrome ubiquinol oxidase subunit I [Nocardiopsis]|jgi:cytochrome d ubiquinol oxidase subunit I|uniref:Cytochrome BD ubiquinol oxidase subunit I n=1 Tax=Nocardiopsis sinuspersici TaxID=501010 RepID=A0A1V3BW08_9ACTN|nr:MULTISPECIES: cytochrome ubiquinol oxidase subunit I [Nocardiopsis]NYH53653.1 cytochrome d ubiquinol oxidase subunit I [Nocardiopsis sinuspersici]OOC52573.1 cytochrome BD ubiquinol oxidase subunit I [Nocardiopsis sinuspersici]
MEALELARWQFGVTTIYHFLFVPLTIGLSFIVAVLQTLWYRTGRHEYLQATQFFGKLFLINFAMGVVTGIVQEFQFGMNWSEYSRFVGDVFGAPLAMEALLAFFLESTFIGLWIFGWHRLPRGAHLACIWLVAVGTNLSAYFILAANAWMRHPVGFTVNEETGRAELTDILAVLGNDQAWSTYLHTVSAAFVTAGLFVVAVSAYKLWRNSHHNDTGVAGVVPPKGDFALFRGALKVGLVFTLAAGALVVFSGDHQAKLAAQYEPMKLAAAEALWETEEGAAFSALAVGDTEERYNPIDITIPNVLSFLATGEFDGEVHGMNNLQEAYEEYYGPGNYTPNVFVVYWSFRLMMGLGMFGVAFAALGLYLTRGRERTPTGKWFYYAAMLALPAALAANIFGWVLTEMGRQPWTVHGELLTAASVSPGVSLGAVATTLAGFTAVYGLLFVVEVGLLLKYVKAGPSHLVPDLEDDEDESRIPHFSY